MSRHLPGWYHVSLTSHQLPRSLHQLMHSILLWSCSSHLEHTFFKHFITTCLRGTSLTGSSHPIVTVFTCLFIIPVVSWSYLQKEKCSTSFLQVENVGCCIISIAVSGIAVLISSAGCCAPPKLKPNTRTLCFRCSRSLQVNLKDSCLVLILSTDIVFIYKCCQHKMMLLS